MNVYYENNSNFYYLIIERYQYKIASNTFIKKSS